jgi:protein-tyrosine phosphatase
VTIDTQRVLTLKGTRNLRDLGGYATLDGRRTRWRTLYRSDCLDTLDEAGQRWLIDAGLRTVLDLRQDAEVARTPNAFSTSGGVAYRHMPLWSESSPSPEPPPIKNGYRNALDRLGTQLCAVYEAMLAPHALPLLFHCAAGKDRTGIVAGLLLAALGVPSETIAADYALSSVCLGPDYVVERRQWVADHGYEWAVWSHLFETPPERMLLTLSYLDQQFGGAERYVIEHGLARGDLARLHDLLTEEA